MRRLPRRSRVPSGVAAGGFFSYTGDPGEQAALRERGEKAKGCGEGRGIGHRVKTSRINGRAAAITLPKV